MNKKLIKELKQRLEKEKVRLEKILGSFAQKDVSVAGDWDTKFPSMGQGSSGVDMEREADEVEQYSTLLPIEHSMEIRLQNVSLALEKIKKGTYGLCEKCHQPIDEKRLKVSPEARICLKCKK